MLVGVCVAFVCLRLPYTVAYYLYTYHAQLWPAGYVTPSFKFRLFVAWRMTDVVATSNYVVNFFMYSMCGSYFRQQVRAAFKCTRFGYLGNMPSALSMTSVRQHSLLVGSNGSSTKHRSSSGSSGTRRSLVSSTKRNENNARCN